VLLRAFLKGVLENRVLFGWFFVVSLWWIRGGIVVFWRPFCGGL